MKPFLVKTACVLALVLVAGYAFFALCGPDGLSALGAKRREIRDLERRNAVLARDIEQRRERINRLRDSSSEQELEIRQRLKLVHPDEKVYVLQEPKK
jgi:cell division protein FtsB